MAGSVMALPFSRPRGPAIYLPPPGSYPQTQHICGPMERRSARQGPKYGKAGPRSAPGLRSFLLLIADCGQRVAQAFQPVPAQAKACGYRREPLENNLVSQPAHGLLRGKPLPAHLPASLRRTTLTYYPEQKMGSTRLI